MRSVAVLASKKFRSDGLLVKRVLSRLGRLLKLKGRYIEVHLLKSNFNVHSFPAPLNFPRPDIKNWRNLGEIHLCPNYIKKTYRNHQSYKSHLIYFLTHGLLHLLGYDHKKKSDRMRMVKKEQELLLKL